MLQITHIYKKEIDKVSLVDSLNYTIDEFKANPKGCFPDWNTETMIASEVKYEHPCLDVSGELREMTKYEKFKAGVYELLENEVEHQGDILVLEPGQYVDEKGTLQTVPKIEGTRVEWNWKTHEWEEKATNLEIVQVQYKEYEGMDTPSTLEEMKQQDPAMASEFITMLIDLRGLMYTLSSGTEMASYAQIHIPMPSEKLKQFKDRFKKYN